jgi:hypothetical protein
MGQPLLLPHALPLLLQKAPAAPPARLYMCVQHMAACDLHEVASRRHTLCPSPAETRPLR